MYLTIIEVFTIIFFPRALPKNIKNKILASTRDTLKVIMLIESIWLEIILALIPIIHFSFKIYLDGLHNNVLWIKSTHTKLCELFCNQVRSHLKTLNLKYTKLCIFLVCLEKAVHR